MLYDFICLEQLETILHATALSHIRQVILVGGVGDWDRLDQVLPHSEIQRDANQDL